MDPKQLSPTQRRAYLRGLCGDIDEALGEVKRGFKAGMLPDAASVDILQALVAELADVHGETDVDLFKEQRDAERRERAGAAA